tara:strand:+ start:726 stop:1031 length:306 start_codon:yes stop_codon:yes gene_type:complete
MSTHKILVYKGAPGYKKVFDGHQVGTEKEYTKEKADEVMRDYPGSFDIVDGCNKPQKEMKAPANKMVAKAEEKKEAPKEEESKKEKKEESKRLKRRGRYGN